MMFNVRALKIGHGSTEDLFGHPVNHDTAGTQKSNKSVDTYWSGYGLVGKRSSVT